MPDTIQLLHANAGRLLGEMLDDFNLDDWEKEGGTAGPYRLCERLGEGGFGNVWLAVQTEPVTREVALKIIKRGMDTMQVLGRFHQERKVLASLNHPSIATILDAGLCSDGRPYFAMELVKGEPITQWCETRHAPVHERLRLFHQVCLAVQHAHQNGIIHRDLKPSNILVADIDSLPMPKVIDFGIAKLMHADVAVDTLLTQGGQILGTPYYMSPEQFDGDTHIDTRSDIYSLGVLLYELLAGTPPFNATVLQAEGFDGIKSRIRHDSPQRLSTLVHKLKRLDGLRPPISPPFNPASPGFSLDLDWITMRALEKDRNRRYQSATEFAADIQRFLCNEPVLACPPSFGYVSSRWIKRHRTAFIASCAVALAMILGTAVALWQARAARIAQVIAEREAVFAHRAEKHALEARQQAESARQQTQQATSFLTDLLDQVGREVGNGRNPEALKIALASSTQKILKLNTAPELRIQLLDKIEGIYSTIGESKLAIPLAREKAEELSRLHGPNSEIARIAELDYLKLVIDFGARATAPGLVTDLLRRVEANGDRGSRFWLDVQRQLSRVWMKLDIPDKALVAAEELMAEAARQKLSKRSMVVHQLVYAAALEFAGKYAQALALLDEASESASEKQLAIIDQREICILQSKGDFTKGAEMLRKKLAVQQAALGSRSRELIPLLMLLGEFESHTPDVAAAIDHCKMAVAIAREAEFDDDSTVQVQIKDTFQALIKLANTESRAGKHGDAIAHGKEALKLAQDMDNPALIIRSFRDISDFQRDSGDLDGAYESKRQSYELIRKSSANLRDAEIDLREMCYIRLEQKRPKEALMLGMNLWSELQARPESKEDATHLAQVAECILTCYGALKSVYPDEPPPKELAQWQTAVEQGKQ